MTIFVAMETVVIDDPQLGQIVVHRKRNVKRFIVKCKEGKIEVSVSAYTSLQQVRTLIDEHRKAIEALIKQVAHKQSTLKQMQAGDVLHTQLGEITITTHSRNTVSLREGTLYYPQSCDARRDDIQQLMKRIVKRYLKHEATTIYPQRVAELAKRVGIKPPTIVKVGDGRQRLGSCSRAGAISLSCLLLMLPPHLMDYVILHELAHLTHFDHSPAFHTLCNSYCLGREKELEKELRSHPWEGGF